MDKMKISKITVKNMLMVLIAALLLLQCCSLHTYAADSMAFTDNNGLVWNYKTRTVDGVTYSVISSCESIPASGVVMIPGEIDGNPVIVGNYAFKNNTVLREVEISEGVSALEWETFKGCTNLQKVNCPTSLTSIGAEAFMSCSSLSAINLSEGLKSIGSSTFTGCSALTEICIPASVNSMEMDAFNRCESLKSIKVNNNNQHYKDIDGVLYTFNGDTLILYPADRDGIKYTIANGTVTINEGAFMCCKLNEVTFPESVRTIGPTAFYKSESLSTVNLNEGLETISNYCFGCCSSLTDIDLPSSITGIIGENAFIECKSITSIDVPAAVTKIDTGAFRYCEALKTVNLPDSLSEIGEVVFQGTGIDQNFRIPSGLKTIPKGTLGMIGNIPNPAPMSIGAQ